ncbi:MAG: glycine C-acetyltransferase [Acidobacteriia bacterium]|nr:glycine C-acetyltransferase [Terriglobia bacterium]
MKVSVNMKLYDKLQQSLRERAAAGLLKTERIIVSSQSAELFLKSGTAPVLNFCSNNYLGLANHPHVVEACRHAVNVYGYGLSSVRFICGTQTIHKLLEERISQFLGTEDTILYSSCFDANGGLFESLAGEEDAIVSARLNHASIIDGVRLAKARKFTYQESDPADFNRALTEAAGGSIIAVTDGVFSMDGILAPLDKLAPIAQKHEALLVVDDSHATGFIGEYGKGTGEHCGVVPDVITGTLGKALGGAMGGFTTGRQVLIDWLRNTSRPYLFSNSLTPSLVAGALAALDVVQSDEGAELRDRLRRNTTRFRTAMTQLGFKIPDGVHPITPVMLGDARLATRMAERLLDLGVYVIGFSFPVVPKDQARIRVQLSAAHSEEQIDRCIESFALAAREEGLLQSTPGPFLSVAARKPKTMRAWVYRAEPQQGGGHLSLEQVEMPSPKPGELLVKVNCASVCGTDEDLFRGKFKHAHDGTIPGHELYGEIVAIGENVRGFKIGQMVAAESHYILPGYKEEGIIGLWGPRVNGEQYLIPLNGGYAEYVVIPTYCAHLVPDVLAASGFFPSLLEGIGNDCLVAKHLFDNRLTGRVAVIGCGYHGLITQLFAKSFGVRQLAAFEIDPLRIEKARTFGADSVIDSRSPDLSAQVAALTGGKGFDAVVDIAGGSRAVLDQCLQMVRDGGTVILFGLYGDASIKLNGLPINDIIFRKMEFELDYQGKRIHIHGITGREGVWPYLIDTVASSEDLQKKIMQLITVMGPLEQLGPDTLSYDPHKVIKRAYLPFSA